MAQGLIHVYYGYGKGKTTAALGLALRASGSGKKVVIVQFLKDTPSGELKSISLLDNITMFRGKAGKMFVSKMDSAQKAATKEIHDANFRSAMELVENGGCDLLILDEAIDAYQLGVLDEELFTALVSNKPEQLELVITGHKPIDWLLGRADYVTEMVKHKHPYDKGITARKGIEF
jgi:cob(I)alamin adenosyltransferase